MMSEHNTYINECEAAHILGVSRKLLQKMRYLRTGPAYHKIARNVRYKKSDLHEYAESRRVTPSA
jgi:predicted DNA-binding transcriptional regulator AlpA